MEEPSVLDYLKSIFKDWKSFSRFARSRFDAARREEVDLSLVAHVPPVPPSEPEPEPGLSVVPKLFPWRSLIALILALMAQALFEPPDRKLELGLVLYLIAAGMVVWSLLRNEWNLASIPFYHSGTDRLTVRFIPLLLGGLIAVVALVDFTNNLFTWHNLLLWMLTVALMVYAFWSPRPRHPPRPYFFANFVGHKKPSKNGLDPWYSRFRLSLKRPDLQWTILFLAVIALVTFFRLYQLGTVPAEPFSDHAEKILDVYDITQGQTHIFFPRNTGREGFQMYLTVAVAAIFGTGLSFLSLKIGTALCGLATLPFIYLLGKEVGNRRVGLLAMLFAGIAYWPNVISRVGLRFPLYPLFTAPTLYYLLRGIRTQNRNDFILSGLFLGLGLHGYSPFRVVPIVVVVAIGLYLLHAQSRGARHQVVVWLIIMALVALMVFMPLMRYALENFAEFNYRTLSRLTNLEQPLSEPALLIFLSNLWRGLLMFNWSNGDIWVAVVSGRPVLDIVSGALFLIGVIMLFVRYLRKRHWLDLFLLLSIPLLMLPSTLSLAFPAENPAPNRVSGVLVLVFLIVALALEGLLTSLRHAARRWWGVAATWSLVGILLIGSAAQNYDLVFHKYDRQFHLMSWNSSEMGAVIQQFGQTYGTIDTVWIVPYPHWVDTRLPGVWAGIPNRDFAKWRDNLSETLELPGPKLFLFMPDDAETLMVLERLYPQGQLSREISEIIGHDFMLFFVP